ncbi:hypothetical protein [Sphingobium yanoikuyae]|jgi:hypothetical protein|uniref:hypothetical protein n=1 Tax=Sphingobium yanoikuyae TaxID=13690 RepID=UPI000B2E63CC|nr:hypothetical protein [Sphingobium yanoikuyae]TKV44122.1 hypothetical protein A0U87_10645 [Sphingobium sp. MP9-4]
MDQPICFNARHDPRGASLSPHRRARMTRLSRDCRVGVTLAARLRRKPPRFSMINGVNFAAMT